MKEFCPILNSLKTLRSRAELWVPQPWPLASSLASADSSRLLPLPAETLKWFKPVSLGLGKDILHNSRENWKRKSVDNYILPWSCMERRADAQFCSCFWVVVLCQDVYTSWHVYVRVYIIPSFAVPSSHWRRSQITQPAPQHPSVQVMPPFSWWMKIWGSILPICCAPILFWSELL